MPNIVDPAPQSKKPKPYMALVEWNDAFSSVTHWEDLDEPETLVKIENFATYTVGWVLPKRLKGHTIVALNLSEVWVGNFIAIPDGMVQKITPLEPAPAKRKKKS